MDFFFTTDGFEQRLDAMISDAAEFPETGGAESISSQLDGMNPQFAWTPPLSPTNSAAENTAKSPWDLDLGERDNTFLKKEDSLFYIETPVVVQGMRRSVLPLDKVLDSLSTSQQETQHAPPALVAPALVAPALVAPASEKHLRLVAFEPSLRRARCANPYIQSILSQRALNNTNWTCAQFEEVLCLF